MKRPELVTPHNSPHGPDWRASTAAGIALVLFGACGEPASTGATTADASPEVVTIACGKDGGTSLSTSEVSAQPRGVEFDIDNRAGEPAQIIGAGFNVQQGRSTKFADIAPGEVGIACYPYSEHEGPEPQTTPLRVRDPHALYVDPELECQGDAVVSVSIDYGSEDEGSREDPVVIVRDLVKEIRDDDVLERASYPELAPPVVRAVRDGRTVARFDFALSRTDGFSTALKPVPSPE